MKKIVPLHTHKKRVSMLVKTKCLRLFVALTFLFLFIGCHNDEKRDVNFNKIPARDIASFEFYEQLYFDITNLLLNISNDNIFNELSTIIENNQPNNESEIEELISQHPEWITSSQTISQYTQAIASNLGISTEALDTELSDNIDSIISSIYTDTVAFDIGLYQESFDLGRLTVSDFIIICYNGAIKNILTSLNYYDFTKQIIFIHDNTCGQWLTTYGVTLPNDTLTNIIYEIEVNSLNDLVFTNIPRILEYDIQYHHFNSIDDLDFAIRDIENRYHFDNDPIYYITAEECLEEYNNTVNQIYDDLAIEAIANSVFLLLGPETYGAAQTISLVKFAIRVAQAQNVYRNCLENAEEEEQQ